MQKRYRWLTLHQFDQTLSQLKPLLNLPVPNTGWIRAIRESLGMTAKQLAKRLGVSPPRITQLEADETEGRVTINTLRRSAEALDCVGLWIGAKNVARANGQATSAKGGSSTGSVCVALNAIGSPTATRSSLATRGGSGHRSDFKGLATSFMG